LIGRLGTHIPEWPAWAIGGVAAYYAITWLSILLWVFPPIGLAVFVLVAVAGLRLGSTSRDRRVWSAAAYVVLAAPVWFAILVNLASSVWEVWTDTAAAWWADALAVSIVFGGLGIGCYQIGRWLAARRLPRPDPA
jgi:hypothetical protein